MILSRNLSPILSDANSEGLVETGILLDLEETGRSGIENQGFFFEKTSRSDL
jgi:hypothetical protein